MSKNYTYIINYKSGVIVPNCPRKTALTSFDEDLQVTKTFPINFYNKNETFVIEIDQIEKDASLNIWLQTAESSKIIYRQDANYSNAVGEIILGKNYQILSDGYEAKEEVINFYQDLLITDAKLEQVVNATPETLKIVKTAEININKR